MSYELTGNIIEIFDTNEYSASFKKREFVVERNEQFNDRTFTDTIKFQLTQDRCSILDNFQTGDEVKITFNIKGSKWDKEGRTSYFVNLDVWKMEKLKESSKPVKPQPAFTGNDNAQEVDDLPF